ncbi:hypothetical protein CL634_05065 [bacterium]|nr:hypothetical protein [bacterium]
MDVLSCEYELPFPEEASLLEDPPDWEEFDFQTFSFKDYLSDPFLFDKYTISEDGQLYKDIMEREFVRRDDGTLDLEEKEAGIERQDYTGEIKFVGMHMEKEHDFFMEFSALFWKGELKEMNLEEWNKESSEKRIKMQEELTGKTSEAFRRKENIFLKVYKDIILAVFRLIRWSIGLTLKVTWRLEGWLT